MLGSLPVWPTLWTRRAFANILRRSIEGANRGFWNADKDLLERLQGMYADLDSELEGIQK